jgi:hypothetical protein
VFSVFSSLYRVKRRAFVKLSGFIKAEQFLTTQQLFNSPERLPTINLAEFEVPTRMRAEGMEVKSNSF